MLPKLMRRAWPCCSCAAFRRVFSARKSLVSQQILHHLRRACTGGRMREDLRHSSQDEGRIFRVSGVLDVVVAA